MAKDIAPEMISSIQNRFQNSYQNNNTIQSLLRKLEVGTASYSEAYQYAQEVSRLTNSAYGKSVTSSTLPDGTMYYNIASRVIPETLEENYELVSSYSAQVQTSLNQSAGIGLKAKTASEDEDRISGIVDLASSAKNYTDVGQEVASAMENYTENIVDRTIEDNVDFQGSCGMTPKVTRIADSGCCEWCSALAGTYSYPTISRDVYRRHLNCHCTVTYDPGTGKVQDVRTKRWTDADEADKIEARKKIGLKKDVDKEKLKTVGINSSIEQRNNDTGKPSAILHYDTDLNTRQQKILNELPEYDSRTIVKKSEVSMIDLSAMTAKTGDEFAMFTKGRDRMLVRGNTTSVNINEEEAAQLAAEGYTWSGHTHPGTAQNVLLASNGDRLILEQFDQDTSVVYDSLGRHLTFTKG